MAEIQISQHLSLLIDDSTYFVVVSFATSPTDDEAQQIRKNYSSISHLFSGIRCEKTMTEALIKCVPLENLRYFSISDSSETKHLMYITNLRSLNLQYCHQFRNEELQFLPQNPGITLTV